MPYVAVLIFIILALETRKLRVIRREEKKKLKKMKSIPEAFLALGVGLKLIHFEKTTLVLLISIRTTKLSLARVYNPCLFLGLCP